MADIATLGIKVENGDVLKATTSLEGLTVAGAKTEAATQRLTRRMALMEIEARNMDATISRNASAIGRLQSAAEAAERVVPGLTTAMKALSAIAVVGFIGRKTIEETEAAQAAMAQLEAAVQSTGGAAGRTVAQLDDLSKALQKQTVYSDEAVKGAEAILLTFDKIRGTEFDRATVAVTNLATRLGRDLPEAALQVGKALQDPVEGLQALQRLGVRFTDSQKAVIKGLVDTGHAAEAQQVILEKLEATFGGSAAAARDTLGGALAGLKNSFGDLFEVTRGGSEGTVTGLNAITKSLEDSGLSMDTFITNTVIGWNNIVAAVQKFNNMMSFDPTKNWQQETDRIRALNDRIDFDRNAEEARLRSPAAIGPAGVVKPIPPAGLTQAQLDAIKKQHQANQDLVRDAEQALDLAGLQGAEQERMRVIYEAQNKVIEAQRHLKGDLLAETLKAIDAEEALKLQAVDRAEQLKIQDDAIKAAKQQLDSMEEDFASKLSKSLAKVFGKDNPLRGLFESLTKDLLQIWISRFVEPAAAAMVGLDLSQMGRAGVLTGESGHGGIADASVSMTPNPAWGRLMAGAAGLGIGYGAGASIGGATGVGVGALGGAAAGFALGGPIGALVGGLSGLAGGLLGASKAAKEAADALHQVRIQAKDALESFHQQTVTDPLDTTLKKLYDDFHTAWVSLVKANEGHVPTGLTDMDTTRTAVSIVPTLQDFQQAIDDYNTLIARAKEAAALQLKQTGEDLQVRLLAAQGRDKEAAALKLQLDQEREREALIKSFGDTIDPAEAATLALLDQVQAQEKLKAATDAANKSALNMVEGYNLQRLVFQNASPFALPNTATSGGGAFTATAPHPTPMTPTGPSLSTSVGGDLHVTLEVSGEKMGTVVLKNFKQQAQRQYGDSTQWGRIQ